MSSSSAPANNRWTGLPFSAKYYQILEGRKKLPVYGRLPALRKTIEQHQVTIVEGATGSGKTTQLPQDALNYIKGKVALTQPKVANRLAEEQDTRLGLGVGEKNSKRNFVTPNTRLDVFTDGSLVALMKSDPVLSKYGLIVIDEAHAHSTQTDLLLGLLPELLKLRPDLKVVIMSATINAGKFLEFFPGSVCEKVEGRQHDVLVRYLPEQFFSIKVLVEVILQVHITEDSGNILVFVSGKGDMYKAIAKVQRALEGENARFEDVGQLDCYPLHAGLSTEEQDLAVNSVAPKDRFGKRGQVLHGRKLIIATNIAETSVTIGGVTHVVDTLRVKTRIYNPEDESYSLQEGWVSQGQAQQRTGRAGRTRPGTAWRMCTEADYDSLLPHAVPSIRDCDMLAEFLTIKSLGQHPLTFNYIYPPARETIAKALAILSDLGIVNQADGRLTEPNGAAIARLPVNPLSATLLLQSVRFGCSDEMLSLVSMLEALDAGSLYLEARTSAEKARQAEIIKYFAHPTGDHLSYLNVYVNWRGVRGTDKEAAFVTENRLIIGTLRAADAKRLELLRVLHPEDFICWKSTSLPPGDPQNDTKLLLALAAGGYVRVAKRDPGFPFVHHNIRTLAEASLPLGDIPENSDWIIYREIVKTGKEYRFSVVTAIPPEYLFYTQPNFWWDVAIRPSGHVQDGIAKVIARVTGKTEDLVRGGLPART
ncbi:hypothetical protein LTR27_002570 [Elasticomyces elasticus]|nr:hypothetical protein LTR27_002570 [Elasticomyces elasticus]